MAPCPCFLIQCKTIQWNTLLCSGQRVSIDQIDSGLCFLNFPYRFYHMMDRALQNKQASRLPAFSSVLNPGNRDGPWTYQWRQISVLLRSFTFAKSLLPEVKFPLKKSGETPKSKEAALKETREKEIVATDMLTSISQPWTYPGNPALIL